MPDAAQFNLRIGYRTERMIAEALLGQWNTLGGFDITRNNMPFPSNKMNSTSAGVNIKIQYKSGEWPVGYWWWKLYAGGQKCGTGYCFLNGGVFYILAFKGHKKKQPATLLKKKK